MKRRQRKPVLSINGESDSPRRRWPNEREYRPFFPLIFCEKSIRIVFSNERWVLKNYRDSRACNRKKKKLIDYGMTVGIMISKLCILLMILAGQSQNGSPSNLLPNLVGSYNSDSEAEDDSRPQSHKLNDQVDSFLKVRIPLYT